MNDFFSYIWHLFFPQSRFTLTFRCFVGFPGGSDNKESACNAGDPGLITEYLGVGDGQGGLACCDSWGRKESDTTERLD